MSSKAETPEFEKSIYNPSGMYGMKVGGETSTKNLTKRKGYKLKQCLMSGHGPQRPWVSVSRSGPACPPSSAPRCQGLQWSERGQKNKYFKKFVCTAQKQQPGKPNFYWKALTFLKWTNSTAQLTTRKQQFSKQVKIHCRSRWLSLVQWLCPCREKTNRWASTGLW